MRSLCCLSLFSGFLQSLTPEGGARRVLRLLSGAVMLAVLLRGLGALDLTAYAPELVRYGQLERELLIEGQSLRDELDRFVIEEEYQNYVEKRASELGITPAFVKISMRWSREGMWVPVKAKIGLASSQGTELLSRVLETELGIPPEKQEWSIDSGLGQTSKTP